MVSKIKRLVHFLWFLIVPSLLLRQALPERTMLKIEMVRQIAINTIPVNKKVGIESPFLK